MATLTDILHRHDYSLDETCYIGDDVADLEVLRCVGLAIAVADAVPEVLEIAHYVTQRNGGNGVVREVCNLILFNNSTSSHKT